jgi:hypothetical protein
MRINKTHLRRIKWILAFVIVFCGLYFAPYEIYNEHFFSFPFVGSIFFAIALYQIFGNYGDFIEFLDSLLKTNYPSYLIVLNIIIPMALFFWLVINYSNRSEKELLLNGITIKAKSDRIETEFMRGGKLNFSLKSSRPTYWLYYSYTVNGIEYHGHSIASEKMAIDYYQYNQLDSIDIVFSKKHHELSEAKYRLYKN